MKPPHGTWFVALMLSGATALGQFVTGFENPPYVSGDLAGQDLWTTSTNTPTVRILTASQIETELTNRGITPGQTVHGGAQALMVSGDGSSNSSVRTVNNLGGEQFVLLDFWARPLTGTATGNVFLTLEDVTGTRAAAVRFGPSTIDWGTNVTGVWQPTSVTWNVDTWYRITMNLDYNAKTYNFWVDGVQMNSSPVQFYNPASVNLQQMRIFRGTNQGGMIVDDLTLVPEPGTAACLLVGVAALAGGRRTRKSKRTG